MRKVTLRTIKMKNKNLKENILAHWSMLACLQGRIELKIRKRNSKIPDLELADIAIAELKQLKKEARKLKTD